MTTEILDPLGKLTGKLSILPCRILPNAVRILRSSAEAIADSQLVDFYPSPAQEAGFRFPRTVTRNLRLR